MLLDYLFIIKQSFQIFIGAGLSCQLKNQHRWN